MALAYIQPIQLTPAAAGGTVRVFLAGSTDAAPTYNPVTGELNHSPLSIDSAGICESFQVDTANSYDLKVYKASGALYLTRENLSSLGGGSGTPGPQGPKGIRGEKGDKGDTGASGTNGTDGINGTNGTDGEDGVSLLTIRVDSDDYRTVYYTLSSNPGYEIPAGYVFPSGVGTVKTNPSDTEGYLQEKLEAKEGISLFTNPTTNRIEVTNTLPETYKVKAQETSGTPNFLNSVLIAGPNTTITPSTDGNSLILSAGGLDAGFNPRGAWSSSDTYNEGDGVWYYDAGVTPVVNRYYIATADAVTTNPYTNGTGWVIMFSIDQQGDMLAKLDSNDPATGYLLNKFEAGTNITFTRVNNIAGDKIVISATGTGGSVTGTPWRIASFDADGNLISNPDLVYNDRDNLALGNRNTITENSAGSTQIGHNNSSDTNDAFVIGTDSTATGGRGMGVAYSFGSRNNVSAPFGMSIGYDVDAGLATAGETVGVGTHLVVDGSEAIAIGQHQDVNGAAFVTVGRNITDETLGYQVIVGNDIVGASTAFPSAQFIAGAKIDSADVAVPSGYRAWTAVFGTTDNWIGFFGRYCDQRGTIAQRGNMLGFDANSFLVVSNELTHADFITSATQTADRAGRLVWDANDKTLSLGLEGGSALQLGQEELVYAVNRTGSTITNGQVVYVSGSQGNRVVVSLAQAMTTTSNQVALAVATQNIADNQTGYFTRFGLVRNINTSAWVEGTILYVGTTAGAMVGTAPAKPYSQLAVGVVTRQHAQVGMILVSPYVVPRLGQLTDVSTTGATDGQALVFDATAGIWKPGSTAASDGKVAVEAGDTPDYLVNQVSSEDGSVAIEVKDGKLDLSVATIPETAATAFRAKITDYSVNQLISTKVPFSEIDFNEGGWTLSDGAFVAPKAGTYMVSAQHTVTGRSTSAKDYGFLYTCHKTASATLTLDWTRVFGDATYLPQPHKIVVPVTSRMQLNYSMALESVDAPTGDMKWDMYWILYDSKFNVIRRGETIKPKACSMVYDHQNQGEWISASSSDVIDVTAGNILVINIQVGGATASNYALNASVSGSYFPKDSRLSYASPITTLSSFTSVGALKDSLPMYTYLDEISLMATSHRSELMQLAAGDKIALVMNSAGEGCLNFRSTFSAALINPVVVSGGGTGGGNGKVMVDSTDTAEYLSDKLIAGTNTTLTETTNYLGFKALQVNLDIPEGHTLYAGKCRRYQKQISMPSAGSQPFGTMLVVGKTADDWAFGSGEVYDYCDGAFTSGYDATTGYFSFPREGLFNVEFSGSAFLYSGSSVPVYFHVVITSSYDNFVTATTENAYQITIDELMSYQDHMTNFSIPALVNNVADGQGRYKKIRVSVTVAPFVSPYNVTCTFMYTYVSINEIANPLSVQGPKGDKGDPGTAGEATLDGLLTFPIILSNTNISTGHTSDQGATYASSRVIPAASVEANFMSCFFTQVGTFYSLRMGIYTPGPAGDTLIAQTEVCTNTPSLGICTLPLTRDGAGNLLTETLYLDPNTSYMPAVVIKANGTNMTAYEGISTNPPNHFGRYDSWNAQAPTNLMPSTASFSQSNTFPWLAISK